MLNVLTSSPESARPVVVPYVTAWTGEQDPPLSITTRLGGGVAYTNESWTDRDSNGVLWFRTPFRPGDGKPDFGRVHPMRQRRAMRQLLCQVCAEPADRTDDGALWLLQDHRDDWPEWPNRMGVTEPPICVPCVRTSVQLCPALRRGAVAVRARRYPLDGVHGLLYQAGWPPAAVGAVSVSFDNPAVRWVRAVSLARELHGCTFVPLDALVP